MFPRRIIFNAFWKAERVFNSHPPFFIFVILLYLVTFLLLLPVVCWRMPFSCFVSIWTKNQITADVLIAKNLQNFQIEKTYLQQLDTSDLLQDHARTKSNPDLVIGIITVKRVNGQDELGYLTQVVSKFRRILKSDQNSSIKLFICDVYAGPGDHTEAIRLGKQFNRIPRFPNGSISASIQDLFDKEKDDYSFCLDQALKFNPRQILLVEDDAVPRPELFKVIKYITKRNAALFINHEVGYLKLYYPERWQGYGFEKSKVLELLLVGLSGGVLFLAVSSIHSGIPVPGRRCRSIRIIIFTLGAIYLALVAVVVGRQHLLELRRFSEALFTLTDAPHCCTPAVLYPAGSASKLSNYLRSVECSSRYPLDFALEEFMDTNNFKRFLVEPSLFRHIGLISSTKGISRELRDFAFALN